SGALGLEALSRGACYCLFVEHNRGSASVIRRNLDALQIVNEGRVIEADASRTDFPHAGGTSTYGLVFFDPPYRLLESRVPDPGVRDLLRRLADHPAISQDAILVTRHEKRDPGGEPDLAPLVEDTRRDVGNMTLRLLR